jgi:hypothetical protein
VDIDPYRNPAVESRGKRRVHVIQFGERPGVLALAAQRMAAGVTSVRVPRFSDRCVCCDVDAGPHRFDYDASSTEVTVDPIEIPVCPECQRHGFISPAATEVWGLLVIVGSGAAGLGYKYWSERPDDDFTVGFMIFGIGLALLGAWRLLRAFRRERAINRGGHYGDFQISVSQGITVVRSSSEKLAADLLALNDDAERLR